jgi:lantibiotic transport system permease protein
MASFVINTGGELLKVRKTLAFWLTIIGSAFIPLVMLIPYLAKPEIFKVRFKTDAWSLHFKEAWQPATAFLMPMFVILVTSLIVQIEYRNNTWKQVYASPRSYADIYFSKYCVVHILILACFILFNMFLVLSGYIANIFYSEYSFFSTPVPWDTLLSYTGKLYVSVLAMTTIQYWISLRFRNYMAPLGIGVGLLIVGFMILGWDKVRYYPYAYPAVTFFIDKPSKPMGIQGTWSFIWMAGILALSFWDTVTRREKG